MRNRKIICIFLACILLYVFSPVSSVHAVDPLTFSFDLNALGKTVTNKFGTSIAYDLANWRDDKSIPISNMPSDYYTTNYPYIKTVALMAATGGSAERDLFVDPFDKTNLTDYNFDRLVNSCSNILRQGLKPYIKTGSVPLKFCTDPVYGPLGTNIKPPDDFNAYYNYIKAIAYALKDKFGINEVRTWKWSVMSEFDNQEWFDAGTPATTKIAYFKLYDYTVAALEDSLGADNVKIGVHGLPGAAGYWDSRELLLHCKNGTNYKTGSTGTQIDFFTISYYDATPVGFNSAGFLSGINTIRDYANSISLTGLEYGSDEGHILNGWDGKALASRDIQHCSEGSAEAKIFKLCLDNNIDWYPFWDYTQFNGVDVPTISGNIRELVYKMTGGRLADVTKSGSPVNAADDVDSLVEYNKANGTIHILVYNNNADYTAQTEEPVTIKLDKIEPISGSTVTIKKWILDEDHANWWNVWWQDQSSRGLTDASYSFSKYSTLPWNLANQSDVDYWYSRNSIYKNQGELAFTTQNVTVSSNKLTLSQDIDHHGVIFYEISNVRSVNGSAAPSQISSPSPVNNAADAGLTTNISWLSGNGATSHDVYFGTSSNPPFVKNQTAITFNPGGLKYDTTYYWRIDERNQYGVSTGTVYSFTTASHSAELLLNPGFESNASGWIVDSCSLISVNSPVKSGSKAINATNRIDSNTGPRQDIKDVLNANGKGNYDVSAWLKAGSGTMNGIIQVWLQYDGGQQAWFSQAFTSFSDWTRLLYTLNLTWSGNLEAAQLRIFTGTGQNGSFYSDDCSLKKSYAVSLPIQASKPNILSGAKGVGVSTELSWVAGTTTDSHDVYFGTSSTPAFIGNQTGTTFNPGTLAPNTTYYWRVDENNNNGTTTGAVWRFTTYSYTPSELLDNAGFENGTNGWITDGSCALTSITSPVHEGSSSVNVTSRIDPNGGPRKDIKNILIANGQGDYDVSAWLKSGNGTMNGFIQIWIQYGGGQQVWYSSQCMDFNDWTKLKYILNISWSGDLEAAQFRIFTNAGQTGSFIADDCSLKKKDLPPLPELLDNAGFENGTNGWITGSSCILTSITSPIHSGSKAVNVTSRIDVYGGPRKDIRDLLIANGPGDYDVSAWLKAGSGTLSGIIQIWLQYNNGQQAWISKSFESFTDWTKLMYTLNINWTGNLEAAQLRIFTNAGQTGSFYADDCSLKKNGQPFTPTQTKSNKPVNNTVLVSTSTKLLTWTPFYWATSHDVYFGTSSTPPFVKNQTGTSFNPGVLSEGTTYYWRIDEKSTGGTTTGAVWKFTTASYSQELINNPGFENGTIGWVTNGSCSLTSSSSSVHSGSSCVSVTNRVDSNGGPRQDIKDILTANGSGKYEASVWLKSGSGIMGGIMQIWIQYDGGKQAWFSQKFYSFQDWTQLIDTLDVTWTGNLEAAQFRIFTDLGQTGSFYTDDCSLRKMN